MESQNSKRIGVLIMALGAIGFFYSFIYFFGSSTGSIEYETLSYMLKLTLTLAFAVLGLYFGLLFYGGRKIALQLGGRLALLLVVAFLTGFFLHQL
jgi:hypothetical protein